MKIKNGKTPIINLPIIKAGDPVTARWANSVTRAIEDLKRRTPIITGVMPKPSKASNKRLPFEIYASGGGLAAEPGTIDSESFSGEELEVESPASGNWFFEAKIEINGTTGAVTNRSVAWTQTPTSSTPVIYAVTMAKINVEASGPDTSTIEQYNYGPMLSVVYGAVDEKFNVVMY